MIGILFWSLKREKAVLYLKKILQGRSAEWNPIAGTPMCMFAIFCFNFVITKWMHSQKAHFWSPAYFPSNIFLCSIYFVFPFNDTAFKSRKTKPKTSDNVAFDSLIHTHRKQRSLDKNASTVEPSDSYHRKSSKRYKAIIQ